MKLLVFTYCLIQFTLPFAQECTFNGVNKKRQVCAYTQNNKEKLECYKELVEQIDNNLACKNASVHWGYKSEIEFEIVKILTQIGTIDDILDYTENAFTSLNKAYEIKAHQNLDNLNKHEKRLNEFKKSICYGLYYEDTAKFNKHNCMSLFPQPNEKTEENKVEVKEEPKRKSIPQISSFYENDGSLRVNNDYKVSLKNVKLFNKSTSLILRTLRTYVEKHDITYFIEQKSRYSTADTCIILFKYELSNGEIEKKCSIVGEKTKFAQFMLNFVSQLSPLNNYDGNDVSLEYYIPFLLKEASWGDGVGFSDNYFAINYKKIIVQLDEPK